MKTNKYLQYSDGRWVSAMQRESLSQTFPERSRQVRKRKIEAVEKPPDDERPGGAVPNPCDQKGDKRTREINQDVAFQEKHGIRFDPP